ncbi:MAG: DUF3014 domain-containing protein [Gammaproteobacteria bacterium]|nr:DUF3014 domain-containing protein [Gammaproteobacteria bacterium]
MADSDKQPVLITLGIVGMIVLGYMGYRFIADKEPEPVTQVAIEIPAEVPQVEPEPEAEPEIEAVIEDEPVPVIETEPSFILPLLDDSDQLIRDGVITLSNHPGIAAWLISDELIRKFVVLVDNTVRGSVPRKHVSFLAPEGPFKANKISEALYVLNEESYARYDLLTAIFAGIDSQRAVEFYVLLQPLFEEAYQELGYTNKKFDDAVFLAIGRMLETPVVPQPIHLVRPVVMYKFADEKLESLSEVQKQLIRMGPKNTRIIHAKLSDIALELRGILES